MYIELKFMVAIFLSLAMFSTPARAGESDDDVELHRAKAQKLMAAKDWGAAEAESKRVTELKPQDLDGWLMYGIIEQRLEHFDEALSAFHKYLDLNPPADKAETVRGKVADLEIRATKQKQEVVATHEEMYGPRSPGAFVAFAPIYDPSTSSVLGGNVRDNFQIGFEYRRLIMGLQYDSGTIPSLLAPNSSGTYVAAGPGTLKTYIMFFEFNPILTEPFRGATGPFSIFIPVHLGVFDNSVNISSGSGAGTYGNFGTEIASGLGAEWYSRSPFKVGATAMYHVGWGFSGLEGSGSSQSPLESDSGTVAYGGNVGFELKLSFTYLFGYEKTLAEKAGVQ